MSNTEYGFTWGQVQVARIADFNGTKVVRVNSGQNGVEVYVSPTGRSIRVFRGGIELKPEVDR